MSRDCTPYEFRQTLLLAPGQHVERDRRVLAGRGSEGQYVEELVVTEHGRERIRAAPRVYDRARRIEQAARHDQDDAVFVELEKLRERDHGDPAERKPDRR